MFKVSKKNVSQYALFKLGVNQFVQSGQSSEGPSDVS